MKQNKLSIIALVVAVIALGGYFAPTAVREVQKSLGAIPGNTVESEEFQIGGADGGTFIMRSQRFTVGSSTSGVLCSVPVPTVASTSIMAAGARIDGLGTSTGVAPRIAIYSGADMNSTTTILAGLAVGANATGTAIVATTSLTTNNAVMGGKVSYINFDYQATAIPYLGVSNQTGKCTVLFLKH